MLEKERKELSLTFSEASLPGLVTNLILKGLKQINQDDFKSPIQNIVEKKRKTPSLFEIRKYDGCSSRISLKVKYILI